VRWDERGIPTIRGVGTNQEATIPGRVLWPGYRGVRVNLRLREGGSPGEEVARADLRNDVVFGRRVLER
jgi:hypothetical protein